MSELSRKDTPSKKVRQIEGVVIEALPGATFKVKTAEDKEILAHLSGKMRIYYIKILPGDRVTMEISPYDETRGRIVRRM
ncbi:MAG TPA: translation initiation factor IF-1 [Candidatus Paceibacterota bacterium]